MNAAQIQAIVDALPNLGNVADATFSVGGIARIPIGHHELADDIVLNSSVWLYGEGTGTFLDFTVAGKGVKYGTTAEHGGVADERVGFMSIRTVSGPAIAMHSSSTAESQFLMVQDVVLRVPDDDVAIDLRNGNDSVTYATRLERVRLSAGGKLLVARGSIMLVDGAYVVNADGGGPFTDGGRIQLYDSSSKITNSWLEGDAPLIHLTNSQCAYDNNHNEAHQLVADGAAGQVILEDGSLMVADSIYFVSPLSPVLMNGGSNVTITLRMIHEDGNGAPEPIVNCYLSDGDTDNQLIYAGHAYIGRQPNPVATIPARRRA